MTRMFVLAAVLLAGTLCAASQPARKHPACNLPNADTIVHGIKLGDSASTTKVLGKDYRTIVDNPASDFGWRIFASRDN